MKINFYKKQATENETLNMSSSMDHENNKSNLVNNFEKSTDRIGIQNINERNVNKIPKNDKTSQNK